MTSTAAAAGASADPLQKWSAYYSATDGEGCPVRPPWESNRPASSVLALVEEGLLPPKARTVELGSGVGMTSIHLARLGHRALAIDLVPAAIEQGRALEASMANNAGPASSSSSSAAAAASVEWVAGDMFSAALLPERVAEESVDLVIDIQCSHIFPSLAERRRVADLAYRLLRPGGLALVVTGNAEEPPRVPGPPALTREEMLAPFLGGDAETSPSPSPGPGPAALAASDTRPGRFRLRRLEPGRFDETPAYGPTPPRCWVAWFERGRAGGGSA